MKQILTLGFCCFISFILLGQAGMPDVDFGNNGQSLILTSHNKPGNINDIALQADGKILAAGQEYFSTQASYAVITRYKTDGTPDSSFGVNGFADAFTQSRYTSNDALFIKVLSNGKILALINAEGSFSDNPDVVLLRYNADGIRDNSFGENGMVIKDIDDIDYAYGMAIQPDGKILFGGQTNSMAFLQRCNADGSTDASFGDEGTVYAGSGKYSVITAIGITSDNKILVSGSGLLHAGDIHNDAFVVKYDAKGQKDNSFGVDGVVLREAPAYGKSVSSLVVLPGDAFLVSCFLFHNALYYPMDGLSKYKADGTFDSTFGQAGTIISGYPDKFSSYRTGEIALQQDGKIILAGQYISNSSKYAIAVTRLLPNGEKDLSFGSYGTVLTHQYYSKTNAVAIQKDGKIVAAGCVQTASSARIKLSLTRYLSGNTLYTQTKGGYGFADLLVKLSPNPVKNMLQVSGLNSSKQTFLTLVNAQGNMIKRISVNTSIYSLKVSGLTRGTYYLQVETGNINKTYQFLKE